MRQGEVLIVPERFAERAHRVDPQIGMQTGESLGVKRARLFGRRRDVVLRRPDSLANRNRAVQDFVRNRRNSMRMRLRDQGCARHEGETQRHECAFVPPFVSWLRQRSRS